MDVTMQQWVTFAIALLIGFLCGSIPFGLVVGMMKGIDVRKHGSGNIGATNVGRVLGRTWGILTFAFDLGKGLVPVAVFGIYARQWMAATVESRAEVCLMWAAVATVCVFGHMFSVFLRFKGGKGVATSLGVLLGLYPYFTIPGLIAFGVWVLVTLVTRYVSLGSVVAVLAFPVTFELFATSPRLQWGSFADLWPLHVFAISMALLVVYRHRGNLRRLYAGTENRIGTSTQSGA